MNESSEHMFSKKDDDNIRKTMNKQDQQESNSTKSKLMSMPNELFDLFLIYLSPCDIIQSLNNINQRLNSLIYRFIHTIDVSSKKKQWLKKHFLPIQSLVTKLTFNHSQLQTLFPKSTTITDRYHSLQSITWNYAFSNDNRLCLSYLNVFKSKLLSLNLKLTSDDKETVHNNVALSLLQDDSCLTELSLKDSISYSIMWFSFAPNTLKMNQHLKRLTIKLHYVHDLFILIEHLSILEYLNVEVCEVEKKDVYNYNNIQNKITTLSPLLKELILNALDFTYPRLLLFLQPLQQSIEYLTLNMSVYEQIDGEILLSTIVTKIPKLKQFKFVFQVNADENININKGLDKLISTFRSTSYWLEHPVICYHDRGNPCFTILSLPWILKESDSLTSEIMNYRVNTTIPLQLPEVKSIFLASTRITSEFLKFIKQTFVNLNKMIISWHTCTIDDKAIYGRNKVKIETIKTLKYYGATYDLEYIDFFVLTPNLQRFIADGTTIHVINGYVNENEQVASICDQISSLHIFRNYSDCDEDEIEETFPNALVISKDI